MIGSWEKRWRQATASLRMRPDFIIPGEAKCGTTSLYRYLCMHPDVFPASMKEPNNFWRHGASPLQCGQHYPLRLLEGSRKVFGKRTLTGEASPEYFTKSGVPESIFEVLPEVKLIFLFRNPVERAVSDYQMLVDAGVEKEPLEKRVKQTIRWYEDARELVRVCADIEHNPSRYLMRGRYADHLVAWLQVFPKEQMLFLESEEFFENPKEALKTVCSFLGLRPFGGDEWPVFKKRRYEENVPDSLRELMADFYRESNQTLENLTGRGWRWA